MTKWDLFQEWKVGSTLGNLLVSYTILLDLKGENPYDYFHRCWKGLK